jgi:hypothetical protein
VTQPTTGVLSTGFVAETEQQWLAEETGDLLGTIANDLDVSPVVPLGQVIAITAEKNAELSELAQVGYNATNRGAAEGPQLDNIGALSGCPRQKATYSSVWCSCVFTAAGTYAAGALVGFIEGLSAQQASNQFAVIVPSINPLNGSPVSASNPYVTGSQYAPATLFSAPVVGPNFGQALIAANTGLTTTTGAFVGQVPVSGWLSTTSLGNASVTALSPTVTFAASKTLSAGAPITLDASGDVYFLQSNVIASTTATLTVAFAGTTNAAAPANLLGLADLSVPSVGGYVESDTHYRIRQVQELGAEGSCTLDAIQADVVLSLQEAPATVNATCSVYENDSDAIDANGLLPHSYQVVVFDGVNPNYAQNNPIIGQQIWNNKPVGIRTYGMTAVTVLDSQGVSRTVSFTRPMPVAIFMVVNVTIASTATAAQVAALITTSIISASQGQEFTAYGTLVVPNPGAPSTLNPGVDVIPSAFQGVAQAQAGVVQVTSVLVGRAANPTSGAVIEILRGQIAALQGGSGLVVNCTVFTP